VNETIVRWIVCLLAALAFGTLLRAVMKGTAGLRCVVLELDEDDWNTVQNEFARQQRFRDKDGPILPDGTSNLPGAMVAESIRNLEEYRSMWEAANES